MKILKLLPFVRTVHGDVGIADAQGSFASTAWCISDDMFNSVRGSKFGWYAPDGEFYTEDKSIMSRPTEKEVLYALSISGPLKRIAIEKGYAEEEKEVANG